MPTQAPQWTEYLSCPLCLKVFNEKDQKPISLACGHTVCRKCLANLHNKRCPYEQAVISKSVDELPVNYALLQLVGAAIPEEERKEVTQLKENSGFYESCKTCIEDLAVHMKSLAVDESDNEEDIKIDQSSNSILSRPMQRKLVTLINSQLVEEEGRARAMRAARSLGERTVAELILQHQNPQQLSANLWAAVRARGCQFLGPAMQEEVLKLILLALVDGSALCRKVLVLFVVQRLESTFPQASKTAIGHVVQLLYRASCFKVTKKEEESSLMQLKEEFRTYESLRREHDSQIVQIAMEAGLRISPEQWSSLLYGDSAHKSHMQSIIDKLQTPESFSQSVNELMIALQRTGDPGRLQQLKPHLDFLSMIDPSQDKQVPSWENLEAILKALKTVVQGLIDYLNNYSYKKTDTVPAQNARYKTSLCRDYTTNRSCPRGANCSFAHSEEELERYRAKKKFGVKAYSSTMSALTPKEKQDLAKVNMKSNLLDLKKFVNNPVGEDTKLKTEAAVLKNLPATNVVKPMMAPAATKTVSLTTDTTTSIATTSAIPAASTSGHPAVANASSSAPLRNIAPRMPTAALQPEAVYYPPQTQNRLPAHNPMQTYPGYAPPHPGVRPHLTGAAARYPPQPYPSMLQYPPDQPPCPHGYPGYSFDGQVPMNYPGQWSQQQVPSQFYGYPENQYRMPGMPPVYPDKFRGYQPMPSVPQVNPVQPTVPVPGLVQPTVQPVQGGVQQPAYQNQNFGNCLVYPPLPTFYPITALQSVPTNSETAGTYQISETIIYTDTQGNNQLGQLQNISVNVDQQQIVLPVNSNSNEVEILNLTVDSSNLTVDSSNQTDEISNQTDENSTDENSNQTDENSNQNSNQTDENSNQTVENSIQTDDNSNITDIKTTLSNKNNSETVISEN